MVRQEREIYFAAGVQWGTTAQTEHPGLNYIQQTRVAWDYFQSLVRYRLSTGRE